jgi:hypothetical protein
MSALGQKPGESALAACIEQFRTTQRLDRSCTMASTLIVQRAQPLGVGRLG